MKKISFLFPFFFVLLTFSLAGQVIGTSPPPATDYHTRVQHVETVTTYYVVDELTEITDLDKVQLKVTKDVKQFSRYYSATAQTPTTIINRVESENIYSDWMTPAAKFVINENGIASFNAAGGLLRQLPHSQQFQDQMDELGSGAFAKMAEMTQQQKNELIAGGINVLTTTQGEIVLAGTARSITINYANKTKSITTFDGNGNAISTITKTYVPVTTINPNHPVADDVVSVIEKEVRKVNLPSGACAEFVRLVQREQYAVAYGEEGGEPRSRKNQDAASLNWYPNPVSDVLSIENPNNETLDISIYNLQGQKVKSLQTDKRMQLNIADLADGVFILSIQSKHDESISKFVKL